MKKLFLAGCLSLGLARLASGQEDQPDFLYQNDGIVNSLTNIDALNFVNNGLFQMPVNGSLTNIYISAFDYVLLSPTTSAFDFSDVTNYVNHNIMSSDLGFIFDTTPSSFGPSRMAASEDGAGEGLRLEDLLPSPAAGPEALYLRRLLLDELALALEELPRQQREVFVAHELEGRSFKEMAADSGVSVNTLLARKRYAVLHLRERLQDIHDEFFKG